MFITCVPFALSIQNEYPPQLPKFVLSVMEISFFTEPAALLQIAYYSDEESYTIEWDFLFLSLLRGAWCSLLDYHAAKRAAKE